MPKPTLLTEEEFRKAAKESAVPSEAQVRKAFVAEVKAPSDGSRVVDFVISTDAVDRSGDTIAVDGWQLANYRKNPVVLWCHDSSLLPVGKASNVRVEDGKLKSSVEFMTRDISGFADAVFQAVKGGFLNACSVGFAPIKYAFSEADGRQWGVDYIQQELLEWSICPVPCNQEALVEMRSAGIDLTPFRAWAEKLLGSDGYTVIEQKRLETILALPEEFRATAKKLPPAAKGATGQLLRCANIAERAIKGMTPDWKMGAEKSLPIDEADGWDGPAAAKRMLDAAGFDGESPDTEKARRGFLAYDAANPTLRGSYKLPFADLVDGSLKAVAGGIRSAASRLPQTDIPDDVRSHARDVLDGYESRMNKAIEETETETDIVPKGTPKLDMARRRLALLG